MTTKTLADVTADMSALYDEVRAGSTELKTADSLANIAGKILKAYQLELARDIFLNEKKPAAVVVIPAAQQVTTYEHEPFTAGEPKPDAAH